MPASAALQADAADRSRLAYLALGANLGDPASGLPAAVTELAAVGEVLAKSALFRTAPVGGPPGQPDYLNAAVLLMTHEEHPDPRTLLKELLELERRLGRERRERWGPRTIDIDLLDLGGRMFVAPAKGEGQSALPTLPALQLPHPRLAERAFVLAPLHDLAPEWRHPTLRRSAAELLDRVATDAVTRLPDPW